MKYINTLLLNVVNILNSIIVLNVFKIELLNKHL